MTIYLYKKTHNVTGLKYLGKTTIDPHKYKGSGKYWKLHIKKHGYDVTTEILKECRNNEEVKYWGSYYSKLWNIVRSDAWANLMEEKGDGVSSEQAHNQWHQLDWREKQVDSRKKSWINNKERKAKQIAVVKNLWADKEFREKQFSAVKKLWEDPAYRKIMHRFGKNHPRCDNTIREWIYDDGTVEKSTTYEMYTKYNLTRNLLTRIIKGKAKSHRGWRLKG